MITIGFSPHHAETLPAARQHMEQHQLIVLEDAPSPSFSGMLAGRVSFDQYMMEIDSGFPEFERLMCAMLQELFDSGRQIVQVEPYLETLLRIHELFADGKTPEAVVKDPALGEVYQAEKRATAALLDYYTCSLKAPFAEVVAAVKAFAKVDADRLRLRAVLRSQAIASLVSNRIDTYVEAGYIHYLLSICLRRQLGAAQKIRVVFLLAPVVRKLGGIRRNMGPGDVLTLHYVLHGSAPKAVADLLAARSLVYIKLLQKEELLPGASEAPHSEDMVRVNRIVDGLTMEQCGKLFEQIRLAKRERALEIVGHVSGAWQQRHSTMDKGSPLA
ncbi:MAG: hypothetical protein SWE60_08945 [Thermodesulfobacteriota bacterium]|nr:hypothetical protein [Thermodesulfobacteriota bacterium]